MYTLVDILMVLMINIAIVFFIVHVYKEIMSNVMSRPILTITEKDDTITASACTKK